MTATATRRGSAATPADTLVLTPRSWKAPIAYGIVALISMAVFTLGSPAGARTSFALAQKDDFYKIPVFEVDSRLAALVLGVLALVAAGLSAWYVYQRARTPWWVPALFGFTVILALLTWSGAGKDTTNVNLTSLLVLGLVASGPLVFGALSGLVCERSGVINIAIEGQLLFGAFLAAVASSAIGNPSIGPYVGLVVAPIAGALVGAVLAIFAVRYWVDQIVVGVVLNVLIVGLTGFLFGTVLRDNSNLNQPFGLQDLPIPFLSRIPILGPVLFNHNLLVYIMFAVVIALHIMLFKSRWGLRVRAVGEHPKAADTVGINVNRTRIRNTILGGAIAGLGGAFFTVAAGLAFGKEMTAGKGFIALAAMILGRWSPKGALAAALLFGIADTMQQQLGIIGSAIPTEFMLMTPYLATIFAVAGVVGHARPPASEGIPYQK